MKNKPGQLRLKMKIYTEKNIRSAAVIQSGENILIPLDMCVDYIIRGIKQSEKATKSFDMPVHNKSHNTEKYC